MIYQIGVSGMSSINTELNTLIDSAISNSRQNNKQNGKRQYLGASRLGESCTRRLQYEYLGRSKDFGKDFNAQTLRIFEAGHVFERLGVKWMRLAGFTVLTEDYSGKQFGFREACGAIAGHVDGIIIGVPDNLNIPTPVLWEMKSMNGKSWRETAKKGLTISKPIYATQIALYQSYMEGMFTGIAKNPALFTAINKDTAELYHELVPFDGQLAQRMSDKAVNIIKACKSNELLPRITSNPAYYECKMCPYYRRCWEVKHE